MAKASIVIPVYNKENYLEETLICVDGQTEDDLEVIIVDDASSDHSMDIISDFVSSTRKQTKVIQNTKNQGVAYSRNIGVEESTSDYITFLDADDILEKDFMEVMLAKAKKYPFVDCVRGVMLPFKKGKGILDNGEIEGYYEEQLIIPKINPDYIFQEIISCNARLYKREFVKNLRFVESCFEDYEFFLETMACCNSLLYTKEAQYGYRFIPDGKYQMSISNLKNSCLTYFDIYDRVMDKYPGLDSSFKKVIQNKQIDMCLHYLNHMLNSNMSIWDKYDLVENYLTYLNCCYDLGVEEIEKILKTKFVPNSNTDSMKAKIKEIACKY